MDHVSTGPDSFLENAQLFFQTKKALDLIWTQSLSTELEMLESSNVSDHSIAYLSAFRQTDSKGNIVNSLSDLYATARLAQPCFENSIRSILSILQLDESSMHMAPLKGESRAVEKANDDYIDRVPGPAISWLFDIVRGAIICDTMDDVLKIVLHLQQLNLDDLKVIRLKNRFRSPTPGGFRDINVNLQVTVNVPRDDDKEGLQVTSPDGN